MNPEIPPPPPPVTTQPIKARSLFRVAFNTVVTIAAILTLGAIVISTSGHTHDCGGRSVDSSNLRQVGQASLIYASDSQDQLPQVDDIHTFAFELARLGGLNDATIWISVVENRSDSRVSTVLNSTRTALEPTFAAIRPSFAAAVRGLRANHPSTTPIAWTRGLQPDGTWSKDSPHGGDGGHIVFLGGNVSWFRKAELIDREGRPTTDLRAALPLDAVIANN